MGWLTDLHLSKTDIHINFFVYIQYSVYIYIYIYECMYLCICKCVCIHILYTRTKLLLQRKVKQTECLSMLLVHHFQSNSVA